MTDVFHVHAYLVCTAGFEFALNYGHITQAFQHLVMGNGVFAIFTIRVGLEYFAEALVTAHGGQQAHLVNPEQARLVVEQAPHNAIDAIHTLSLVMAIGPIVAIILAIAGLATLKLR